MPHGPSRIRSPSLRPSARYPPSTSQEHPVGAAPSACYGTSRPGRHAWRAGGPPATCLEPGQTVIPHGTDRDLTVDKAIPDKQP
jgi:uncharacterized membrane protein